jgi:hypothetical protein
VGHVHCRPGCSTETRSGRRTASTRRRCRHSTRGRYCTTFRVRSKKKKKQTNNFFFGMSVVEYGKEKNKGIKIYGRGCRHHDGCSLEFRGSFRL